MMLDERFIQSNESPKSPGRTPLTDGKINVLIVDDHTIVREGVKRILADTPDIRVAGEAGGTAETITLVRDGRWDAVLLEVALRGGNGLKILEAIRAENPKLPVLVFTMYPEDPYALRALRAGAAGYLTKERSGNELVAAVRKVAAGGKYVSEAMVEKLAWELSRRRHDLTYRDLSNRELEILRLLAGGRTVSQIAGNLHLSVKTVSTYRTRLLTKLVLKSNAQLMQYAIKNGLTD